MRVRPMMVAALLGVGLLAACGSGDDDAADQRTDDAAVVDGEGSVDGEGTEDGEDSTPASEPQRAGKVDACGLFDLSDAETAVGGIELEPSSVVVPESCTYSAKDPSVVAQVTVQYVPNGLAGVDVEGLARAMGGDGDPTPVPTIDGALALNIVGMETIVIPDGTSFATVSATDQGGSGAVVAFAEVVAGNL